MKVLLYIISISLQISGALLLMLFSLSTNRKKVIKNFINKDIITKDSDERIDYNKEELKETFKTAYLNKFSFGFIALGYLIGVIGEIDYSYKLVIILGIIIFTLIFMILAYLIVHFIMKYSKEVNKELTEEEMIAYNIDPTITMVTQNDIDELFKD